MKNDIGVSLFGVLYLKRKLDLEKLMDYQRRRIVLRTVSLFLQKFLELNRGILIVLQH